MQNTTFHKHVHTPTAITLNNVTIHPSPCGINHSYFNIKLKEVATAVKASVNIGSGEYGWGASSADYEFKSEILNKQKNNMSNNPNTNIYPSAKFGINKCRGNDKQIIYY